MVVKFGRCVPAGTSNETPPGETEKTLYVKIKDTFKSTCFGGFCGGYLSGALDVFQRSTLVFHKSNHHLQFVSSRRQDLNFWTLLLHSNILVTMPKPTNLPANYGIGIFDDDKIPHKEEEQDANDNVMDDSPPKITAEVPEGLVPIIPSIKGVTQPHAIAHVNKASAAVASIVAQKKH
jgi:hypothetical protein